MLFFTHTITPRLSYITDFIGKEITGKPLLLTDNREEYKASSLPKINYSNERVEANELHIAPHSLLFEKGIKPQATDCFLVNDFKIFFKTRGDLPFDIFAASFYLLSRYEEYLPHDKDIYGRYAHENSLAFKEKFLGIPLLNKWLHYFKEKIKEKISADLNQQPVFNFIPTYDVDEAYSFRHKQLWRTAGGLLKDAAKGNFSRVAERIKVIRNRQPDPYDSYEWMDDLHGQFDLNPVYFFHVAAKTGKYDRNILPRERSIRALIRQHADKYKIGVHPSWQSGDKPRVIKQEINTVEDAAGLSIIASRQHFIRLSLPQTYRLLIDAGIREDFSMGYGSINGFRASAASLFYWYDLEKEQTTNLLLYPFCFMDANSFFEQKLSSDKAFDEIMHYWSSVKNVNGIFISIWHNTFLGTDSLFKGWREMYQRFLKEINT